MLAMTLLCGSGVLIGVVTMPLRPSALLALDDANPAVDNDPAIITWMKAGKRLPPGRFYVSTPINTSGEGCRLLGSAAGRQARADSAWDGTTNRTTAIIWNGANDAGSHLIEVDKPDFHMEDIQLVGTPLGAGILPTEPSDITLVYCWMPVINEDSVSFVSFDRVTFVSAEYGIYIADGDETNHFSSDEVRFQRVNIPYSVNEENSVSHHIKSLTVLGSGDTIFEISRGGRLKADFVTIVDNWNSILRWGTGSGTQQRYNAGYVDIYVTIDATTYIDNSIVETDEYVSGDSYVNITGHASSGPDGTDTTMGDPIELNDANRWTVNIVRMIGGDFVWPAP